MVISNHASTVVTNMQVVTYHRPCDADFDARNRQNSAVLISTTVVNYLLRLTYQLESLRAVGARKAYLYADSVISQIPPLNVVLETLSW